MFINYSIVIKLRSFLNQAFASNESGDSSSPHQQEPMAKRSKIGNCHQFESSASSCLILRNNSSDRELIDLVTFFYFSISL